MAAVTEPATRPVRGVRPIDRLFLAYLLVNTATVLARAGAVPTWPLLLAVNAAAVLVPLFAARAPRSALADFLGGTYPLLLAPAFYTQLGLMTGAHGVLHDPAIQRLEAALFGAQPSLTWHDRMPQAALSWALHAGYASYYPLVYAAPLYLFARRSREAFERSGFLVALGLYACYVAFALYPVAGPRFMWGNATGVAAAVLPARLLRRVLDGGSALGTAFPSSHVASSWCAVFSLWPEARTLALVLAPVAVALTFGTVYGQFHYAADALAGALVAVLLCALADPLRRGLAWGSSR